jgi:hypothetical protein
VHLGDAEPLADLRLGQAVLEVHDQDLLLAPRQLAPVRGDGVHAEQVLQPRILLPERVGQAEHGGLAGQQSVQRGRLEGQLRLSGPLQLIPAHSPAGSLAAWSHQFIEALGMSRCGLTC